MKEIADAYYYCASNTNTRPLYHQLDEFTYEQLHHAITNYALAAWCALRDDCYFRVTQVAGLSTYLVPDLEGKRIVEVPALLVATATEKLYLTGCSWGYSGEGPRGTALILHDLELFKTFGDALQFVAGRKRIYYPWSIGHASGVHHD